MLVSTSTEPLWAASAETPKFSTLSRNLTADVCVVGGGIAGLTTAYFLGQAGQQVVLLDDGEVAGGMTLVTSAHLSNVIDDHFTQMEKWHGEPGAKLAAESHGAAVDCIEWISNRLGIDCDFQRVPGYLFLAPETPRSFLDDELAAAHRAGLADARLVSASPVAPLGSVPAIRFPRQARFHPLRYCAGLAEAIEKQGGKIFTHSHVDRVEGGDSSFVQVGKHRVTAASVVVTTNVPINNLVAIHTKQAPYMSYVIAVRIPEGSVEDALYWDTEHLYHYVRVQPMADEGKHWAGHDLLIVGGEDHKSGQAEDTEHRHDRLLEWAQERFPMIEEVEFTWGGQYMETVDGLAFIGRNPLDKENVYVVTGDSGMGLTHGTIAGMLLTDMILGRTNPWEDLYDPSRKTVPAAGRFLSENINTASQYTDWLTPGEVDSVDEIENGCGAIVRSGLKKLAVYRDEDGHLTQMSAVCPHLKCIVAWNAAEKTWDCPCHGSRFHADGEVINGPANAGLARVAGDDSQPRKPK